MLHPNPLHHFDLSSPAFTKNPHPYFEYLRKHKPIIKIDIPGGDPTWLLTRYEDTQIILKDNDNITKHRSSLCPYQHQHIPQSLKAFDNCMLNVDPPDHTRLRRLISKAFTPRAIESLKPRMHELANDLIDEMMSKEDPDLMRDFATPFPFTVICEMLGVPKEAQSQFGMWSNQLIQSLGNQAAYLSIEKDMDEFLAYTHELISLRKNDLQDDIISSLIQAHEGEDKLTEEELAGTIIMLMTGGYETTLNLICNGVLSLLEHPEQLALWKEDPNVRDSAIEEFLRYYPPIKTTVGRWAKRDFEYLGEQIKLGDAILCSVESANRDEQFFDSPNRFDITRKNNKHIAFGEGVHFCLGAFLTRVEARIAMETLLDRLPNLTSTKPLYEMEWEPGIPTRVLTEFPIKW
ncbi:cytochrome P450 family protein [Longirhabdus pacifica]|uniref:cytochrome P450 family protein n=1 Tax=Longirhabdus pacifica TaxID=2305227 RepID=UPI0010092DFA|nr:cytochrome P450 [Longirhabdus pacifica]